MEQAKGLPRIDVLVVLLPGRLAVDKTMQGRGLGSLLLLDALRSIRAARALELPPFANDS